MLGFKRSLIGSALFLISGLSPLTCLAQSSTGKIFGTVTDQANAVVAGVVIRAKNLDTRLTREVRSSDGGYYELLELPAGNYEVTAEAAGFRLYVRPQVAVTVNQSSQVEITLQTGELTETVIVDAEANLAQTDAATLKKVMDKELIAGLPLNGRNFYDLGLLQTGVLPLQPGRSALTQNSYNVNGARDTSNNFLLDGVANQELEYNGPQIRPSIDAVAEFIIHTNLYSAEFGRNSGAIMNVVTKSGSGAFHGSLFEFIRDDSFDARNFFSAEVPLLRRHQFGATLGGPIGLTGRLDNEPRTFFFLSYEGLRQRRGITTSTVVPTAAERRGDLSAVQSTIIDPLTGQPFPNNIIPPERINAAARALLALYPSPNVPARRGR